MTNRELIKKKNKFYAHKKKRDGEKKELLEDHLDLTLKYYKKIYESKNLSPVFERIFKGLFISEKFKKIYDEMIEDVIYYHDIGKVNPLFQREIMQNKDIEDNIRVENSNHSYFSSLIYMRNYLGRIDEEAEGIEENDLIMLYSILTINMGIIQGHHGSLKSKEGPIFSIAENDENFMEIAFFQDSIHIDASDYSEVIENYDMILGYPFDKEKHILMYIYSRLLFGLLTQSDILATMDYMADIKTEDFGLINNTDELLSSFNDNEITKTIRRYEEGNYCYPEGSINELRSEMFLEAERNLQTNKNIFMLEAPTGAGKTNISINLALKLLEEHEELNKLFYAFPFNTLVEQTYNGLLEIYEGNKKIQQQISIYNSINSFEDLEKELKLAKEISGKDEEQEEILYQRLYRDYQFLYYPISISTNIKLFDCFFGNQKSSYYPFPLLANSVIIMDEIQSYKNSIWQEMIEMLGYFAEILNIKIIIMSATLPGIESLIHKTQIENVQRLIEEPDKYYQDQRFKNRVLCDYSLLGIGETENKRDVLFENIIEIIEGSINGKKLILVEFIKKDTAKDFYNKICDLFADQHVIIKHMDGDTSRKSRKDIIKVIKAKKNKKLAEKLEVELKKELEGDYILVSTQVVEAGVDIDMDIGFKDISLFDSEEQFLGRINRNFKSKDAVAYFFDLDSVDKIYKNDVRTESSLLLKMEKIQELLNTKNFKEYYKFVLDQLVKDNKDSSNNIRYKKYETLLKELDMTGIEKHFKLINKADAFSIYLNINNSSSDKLWEEYKDLLNSEMDFSEKKIKLINLRGRMDEFTYEIYSIPTGYQDYYGGIYYYDNGEIFMDNGRFDSRKMNNDESFDFL